MVDQQRKLLTTGLNNQMDMAAERVKNFIGQKTTEYDKVKMLFDNAGISYQESKTENSEENQEERKALYINDFILIFDKKVENKKLDSYRNPYWVSPYAYEGNLDYLSHDL